MRLATPVKSHRFLVILFYWVMPAAAFADTDLKEALRLAREQSPLVKQAREKVEETRAMNRVVIGGLLPTLNGTLSYQQRKDSLNSNAPLFGGEAYTLYQVGLSLNQPLLQGTALWDSWLVSKKDVELAEVDLKLVQRDLDIRVAKAFFQVLLYQKTLANLEANRQLNQKSVDTSEKRRRVGKGQWVEVLQAKTQSALLVPKIAQTKNQLNFAASELALLLKLDPTQPIHLIGKLGSEATEKHYRSLLSKKEEITSQLEIQKANLSLQRMEKLKGVSFSKHLPSLGLFANFGQAAFVKSDLMTPDAGTWSLGLQATIPLFSGLTSVNERAALLAQTRQLEQNSENTQNEQLLIRLKARNSLQTSFETLASTSEALKLAKQSLAEAQKDFGFGTIDYQGLLVSQQSLLNAETAYDQAQFDWVAAELDFCVSHQLALESCIGELK